MASNKSNTGRRTFSEMDPEEHRQISRKGGLASHGGSRSSRVGSSSRGGRSSGRGRRGSSNR